MALYSKFRYYFPPRPESRITDDQIDKYVHRYFAQPKANGANCTYYISPEGDVRNFGRHKNENLSNVLIENAEIAKLNTTGKWMVLCGEYMNKNKQGLDGKKWNHKFIIFDILVYKDNYLSGSTFQSRVVLLDEIFGKKEYNDFFYTISENVLRVKTFYGDEIKAMWLKIKAIDSELKKKARVELDADIFILEGLVLKKIEGKLEKGFREKNNTLTQIKLRLPKKNYFF